MIGFALSDYQVAYRGRYFPGAVPNMHLPRSGGSRWSVTYAA
jgi:hypothetical protein